MRQNPQIPVGWSSDIRLSIQKQALFNKLLLERACLIIGVTGILIKSSSHIERIIPSIGCAARVRSKQRDNDFVSDSRDALIVDGVTVNTIISATHASIMQWDKWPRLKRYYICAVLIGMLKDGYDWWKALLRIMSDRKFERWCRDNDRAMVA